MTLVFYLWIWVAFSYTVTAWMFWQYRKAKKSLQQSYDMHCDSLGDPERQAANIIADAGNKWLVFGLALFMSAYSILMTYSAILRSIQN